MTALSPEVRALEDDVDSAAALLGVSPRTIRRLAAAREVAHYRVGQRPTIMFRREDLEDYLRRCRVEAIP